MNYEEGKKFFREQIIFFGEEIISFGEQTGFYPQKNVKRHT